MKTPMPEIGQLITVEWGLQLAKELFGKDHYIVERIETNMSKLSPFKFDGISGIDEEKLKEIGVLDNDFIDASTFAAALLHDLLYWAGKVTLFTTFIYNKERREADKLLREDVFRICIVKGNMDICKAAMVADVFYAAVRPFGWQGFKIKGVSWGFGWKK